MANAWLKWTMPAAALMVVACATYPDAATTRQLGEKMVSEDFTAPTLRC